MTTFQPNELTAILERYNSFQECILLSSNWRNHFTSVDLVFNYIWDDLKNLRSNIDDPFEVAVRLELVQSFELRNQLTEGICKNPERLNWGFDEVALVRIEDDPEVIGQYSDLAGPFHRLAVHWESGRRIHVVFKEMKVEPYGDS